MLSRGLPALFSTLKNASPQAINCAPLPHTHGTIAVGNNHYTPRQRLDRNKIYKACSFKNMPLLLGKIDTATINYWL